VYPVRPHQTADFHRLFNPQSGRRRVRPCPTGGIGGGFASTVRVQLDIGGRSVLRQEIFEFGGTVGPFEDSYECSRVREFCGIVDVEFI
jgi:hypothetical protein